MHRKRHIGRTGIMVSPIGLGALPLSAGERPTRDAALSLLHAAFAAGTDFIDTANAYCQDDGEVGHNERLIATALETWSGIGPITVATKGGVTRPEGRWEADGHPAALRLACEQSLSDLGVEAITLYHLHTPDSKVPFADSVGELARLQEEGKVLHLGLSNVTAAQLVEAQGIVRIESVQNKCHPFCKGDLQSGLVAQCGEQDVTYIAYCPVGGHHEHQRAAAFDAFVQLSRIHEVSPYCIMLAWLLAKGDNIIPIPGARRITSATDSPTARDVHLTPEQVEFIDQLPDVGA